jgi:Flp pilus assembly pilin Flp
MRRNINRRSGISAVQWIVVAALIVLVVFATVQVVGNRSSTKMNQTATDLTNPTNLTKHMGS